MRILLDSCVWPGAKEQIARAGHEVEWVGDWPSDPGDAEILARAADRRQIIVTLDKDFGELAVAFGRPHSGILRLVDIRHERQGPVCLELLTRQGRDLEQGAIVTAEPSRVRIRAPR